MAKANDVRQGVWMIGEPPVRQQLGIVECINAILILVIGKELAGIQHLINGVMDRTIKVGVCADVYFLGEWVN